MVRLAKKRAWLIERINRQALFLTESGKFPVGESSNDPVGSEADMECLL